MGKEVEIGKLTVHTPDENGVKISIADYHYDATVLSFQQIRQLITALQEIIPIKDGEWFIFKGCDLNHFEHATKLNCLLKFSNGDIRNYNDEDWPTAEVTHYRLI